MTNREKIIVGVMVLTVGYGAIELLLPRSKGAGSLPATAAEGVNAFIAKVADAIKSAASDSSALVVQKAEAAWKQDPFLEIRKPQAPRTETAAAKDTARLPGNLVYSGFIESGAKRMAIINGMEYEAGDTVNPGGFTVKSVLPTKVLIGSPQRDGAPIELPLKDIE
ncbi:MAG: general secretion pathway protein GspB [Desulfobacterales bacterium]|jgi:hypothetical protein|nr:general secretion pathway protein GspB [Desulfobacterales bacterium]